MQRQRDSLVPAAEVLSGLPGPVQALRETPPPAQRGFTLAAQVNQLVSAREADAPISVSWRAQWRSAPCRAPTPATGFGISASTGRSRSICSRGQVTSCPTATYRA